MHICENIGQRLDRLPVSEFHYRIFITIGFSLLITGFLSYSGNIVIAELVSNGWSNNYLNAAFTSALMLGYFVGSLAGGFLGDRIGRRVAFNFALIIVSISAVSASFSPNMYWLIFFRFLMGTGMGALIMIGYASFTEFIPASVRGKWSARLSFVGNWSPLISSAISAIIIPAFGWRAMFMLGGVLMFTAWTFSRIYFIESPRWLLGRGKGELAEKKVQEIEKNIEHKKNIKLPPVVNNEDNSGEANNESFKMLFSKKMIRRTLVAIIVLVAMNISLYTITVWIPTIFVNSGIDISKSIYMTSMMMIGAPLGVFSATIFIDRFPRRLFGSFLLFVISVIGYFYSLQKDEFSIITLGFVMIFFLYMYVCFASAVYVPELWPTHMRLRGSGFVNSVGRMVAVFTPYLVAFLLTQYNSIMVFKVLGAVLIICSLIIFFFGVETRKVSLERICS